MVLRLVSRKCQICKETCNARSTLTTFCDGCKFYYHRSCLDGAENGAKIISATGQRNRKKEETIEEFCGPCLRWRSFMKIPIKKFFIPRHDMTETDKFVDFLDFYHQHTATTSLSTGVAYSKFPLGREFFGKKFSTPLKLAAQRLSGPYDLNRWTENVTGGGRLWLQQTEKKYVDHLFDPESSSLGSILKNSGDEDEADDPTTKKEKLTRLISGEMTVEELVEEMSKSVGRGQSFPYKVDQPGSSPFEYFDFGPFDMNGLDEPMARHVSKDMPTIPGCTTPVIIVASKGSPSAVHGEDNNFNAINIHLAGGIKLWTILHPNEDNIDRFVGALHRESGQLGVGCGFDFRQKCYFVPLDLLFRWNVTFSLVLQQPGEMILTSPLAFHQIFNWDSNVSVARNFIGSDWQAHRSDFVCTEKRSVDAGCPHSRLHGQDLNSYFVGNVYGEWKRRKEQKNLKRALKKQESKSLKKARTEIANPILDQGPRTSKEEVSVISTFISETNKEVLDQNCPIKKPPAASTGKKTLILYGLKLERLTPRNHQRNLERVKTAVFDYGHFLDCRMHKKFIFLNYPSGELAAVAHAGIVANSQFKVQVASQDMNRAWTKGQYER